MHCKRGIRSHSHPFQRGTYSPTEFPIDPVHSSTQELHVFDLEESVPKSTGRASTFRPKILEIKGRTDFFRAGKLNGEMYIVAAVKKRVSGMTSVSTSRTLALINPSCRRIPFSMFGKHQRRWVLMALHQTPKSSGLFTYVSSSQLTCSSFNARLNLFRLNNRRSFYLRNATRSSSSGQNSAYYTTTALTWSNYQSGMLPPFFRKRAYAIPPPFSC